MLVALTAKTALGLARPGSGGRPGGSTASWQSRRRTRCALCWRS